MFIDKELATKVTMGCRVTPAHKFRRRFVFKQYNFILNKEQESVLSKRKVHLKKHENATKCVRL